MVSACDPSLLGRQGTGPSRMPLALYGYERPWACPIGRRKDHFMSRNVKQCLGVLVVAAGFGVGVGTVQAVGAPFQEHEQDYSKNKNYQQGVREGHSDQ